MNRSIRKVLLATALASSIAAPAARADLPTKPVLPLAVALKMVGSCIEYAAAKQLQVSVVVRDSGANVVAAARMDGAALGTFDVAMEKARASAVFPMPTAAFAKYAFDEKTGMPTAVAFMQGVVLVQGGLPIKTAAGVPVGSIGVSGAPSEQDEACGQAGIDAVKDELK